MKTKMLLLVAVLIVAGIVPAMAQSNPGSTNGTDIEMKLPWPDGTVYANSQSIDDHYFGGGIVRGVYSTTELFTDYSWQETSGGTGHYKAIWTGAVSFNPNHDDLYNWPGGRWPEFASGTSLSLLDGSTNGLSAPSSPYQYIGLPFGSVNYSSYYSPSNFETFQYNHHPELVMVTGGEAGSTDTELYGITGYAVEEIYGILPDGYPVSTAIPPEQIQIGNLGNLTTSSIINGLPYGTVYAVLPTHQGVPVTPKVGGSKFYYANVSAQGYKLVSQCVATTPTNQARTTIGVGEQVNLSFSPTLSVPSSNIVWSTTGGGLSSTHGNVIQFTAPSRATAVTVTASVLGKSVSKSFTVIEPSSYDHAQIIATNHDTIGIASAGMTNVIWIKPINVSFYRVSIMEVGEIATNATGYFANTNIWPTGNLDHGQHGANHWTILNQANTFRDSASSGTCPSPWSSGNFTWPIPAVWQVGANTPTNSMTGWNQNFSIDAGGTVIVQKFGHTVIRTPNDVITTF